VMPVSAEQSKDGDECACSAPVPGGKLSKTAKSD
jgi:hypothetical protein